MSDLNKSTPGTSNYQASVVRSGVVLPRKHPTDPSLYYVSFGDKTSSITKNLDSGVWCHNGISGFVRYRNADNKAVSYGSYTPIQPWTPVRVEMSHGGVGSNTIVGFMPTNTGVPNIDNTDGLHVMGLTPNGSTIEMDDKIGAVRILYNKGSSGIVLAEEFIGLEVTNGVRSGKELNSGIQLRKGAIVFKLRDSQMQFDESGLSVSFDDGGTSMKITKKGVIFEGQEIFKVSSKEQVSIKGSKMTLEGSKDASLSGNEVKVGGKQITNISGSQINIESIIATTIKSMAVNLWATAKYAEFCGLKDVNVLGADVRTCGLIAETSATHNVVTGAYAVASGVVALDATLITNMGLGVSIATPAYTGSKATMVAVHAALTAMGTALLTKVAPVSVVNKILADTLAGTSEPAMEASGNVSGARDKKDKKSLVSVASSEFIKNKSIMEKYSVVPNLLAVSANSNAGQDNASTFYNAVGNIQKSIF